MIIGDAKLTLQNVLSVMDVFAVDIEVCLRKRFMFGIPCQKTGCCDLGPRKPSGIIRVRRRLSLAAVLSVNLGGV